MENYRNGAYVQGNGQRQQMSPQNLPQQCSNNAPAQQNRAYQQPCNAFPQRQQMPPQSVALQSANGAAQQNRAYQQPRNTYPQNNARRQQVPNQNAPQQGAGNVPARQRTQQSTTNNNGVYYSDQIVQLASKGKFLELCDALNFASDQFFCHVHGEGGNKENNKFTGFPSSIKLRITDYSDKSVKAKVVTANIAPYVVDMIKSVCVNNIDPFHIHPNNVWEYSQTRPNPYSRRQDGKIPVTQLRIAYNPFINRGNALEPKKRAWDISIKTFWATSTPNKTPPYDKNSACDTATSTFSCTNEEMYKAVYTAQRFIVMWENAHLSDFIKNMNAKRSQAEQRYARQQNQDGSSYGRNTVRSCD